MMQVAVSRRIVPITISPLDSCRGRRNTKNISVGFYQQQRYFTNNLVVAMTVPIHTSASNAPSETIITINK
jgi:hypothetical protein